MNSHKFGWFRVKKVCCQSCHKNLRVDFFLHFQDKTVYLILLQQKTLKREIIFLCNDTSVVNCIFVSTVLKKILLFNKIFIYFLPKQLKIILTRDQIICSKN